VSEAEPGQIVVTRVPNPGGPRDLLQIVRADPRCRILAEVVAEFRDLRQPWAQCTEDGVVTLTDDFGQRFIYRIDWGSYDSADNSFLMEWPD
jgi:hypothetical protein